MTPDERATDLAAGQYGLVTLQQVVEAGLTPDQIRARVRSGRWLRPARGLFRVAGCPVTWQQGALAACLAGPPGTVASHLTAAAVWSLSVAPVLPHVTVPLGASARSRLARTHRSALDGSDVTRVGGIPVTTPARTLVDVAILLPERAVLDMVDAALCRRLASRDEVEAMVERLGRGRGQRGSAAILIDRALAVWTPGASPDSPAEMRAVRCLVDWGFPMPERQFRLYDERGRFVARFDLAWPQHRIALEYDGVEAHGPRRAAADERRQVRAEALGWYVARAEKRTIRPGATELRAELHREFTRRAVA